MKRLLTISISSLLISVSLNAHASDITCPSASAISEVGINVAFVDENDHSWQAGLSTPQHYGTSERWQFGLGSHTLAAENEETALNMATKALGSLKLVMGPVTNGKGVACYYSTNESSIMGIAFTT